ncbi:MAG: Clp protease N-terminal domain-containing protein, partial [bacterium]|nr:Clp protease N-terminal domain-containing protein [bacterium]
MRAQSIAQEKNQQQIDALHLLLSLLTQDDSVVLVLLGKLGVDL